MVVNFYEFMLNGNYIQIYCYNEDADSGDRTLLRMVFIPLTSRIITDVTEVDGNLMVNNLMLLLENSALISINRFSEEILRDGTLVSDLEPQKAGQQIAMFAWDKERVEFDEVINRMAQYTGVTMVSPRFKPTDGGINIKEMI
jgi:hypothetical protein